MPKIKTRITEMFHIDVPIVAFCHSPAVVAAVSKAGGLGVLGCSGYSVEHLREMLDWIDANIDGKPYGVNMVMPAKVVKGITGETKADYHSFLPEEMLKFNSDILDAYSVPQLPQDKRDEMINASIAEDSSGPEDTLAILDLAFQHPIALISSALGPPPVEVVERAHAAGIKVAALAGAKRHAMKNIQVGCDILVAQGHEAGGHTGKVTSMILWPEIAEFSSIPVLAAGGVGSGKQLAAALALGVDGAWCGTIWLGSCEDSWSTETEKDIIYHAEASDSVQSRHRTGKPCRMTKSAMSEAWADKEPLVMPLQAMLYKESQLRLNISSADPVSPAGRECMSVFCGQNVGRVTGPRHCGDIIMDMVNDCLETIDRLKGLVTGD